MSKIKTIKAFKEGIDAAFETLKTRDEAKACYDYAREDYKAAEADLCAFAAANPAVFEGRDGVSGWGATDTVVEEFNSERLGSRAGARLLGVSQTKQNQPKHNHTDQTRKETKHEQDQDDQGVQGRHRRRL